MYEKSRSTGLAPLAGYATCGQSRDSHGILGQATTAHRITRQFPCADTAALQIDVKVEWRDYTPSVRIVGLRDARVIVALIVDPMENDKGEITVLLQRISAGDSEATEKLAEAVYADLRRIARNMMGRQGSDHSLQPTAIAGEAYLALVDHHARTFENRAHFFAVAAKAMRRILVDYARRKRATKRGGQFQRVELENIPGLPNSSEDLIALDEALDHLAKIDNRQSRIVEMRFFGGLTEEQTAQVLGLSHSTIRREWLVARSWLYAQLTRRAE